MASGPRFLSGADLQGQIDQISSQISVLSNTMGSNHSIVTSQLSQLETTATNAHTVAQQASTAAQQAAQAATAASNSVQVSNATMSAIQTAQASIQSSLQGHTTELSTLSASCAAANSSVTSLSSQHASEVQNLQSQLSALTGASNSVTDLETELNRVDGRITSVSNNAGLTRSVVDQLIQEVVHASASWPVGSGVYTIPSGEPGITTSLDIRVTALEGGGGGGGAPPVQPVSVEVFDSSSGQLLLNFVLDGTAHAIGTPTSDITHDVADHALVLPSTSSQIVKSPSQPDFSFNHTWYMVLSLDQTGGQQYLWQHGDLSMRLMQGNFPNNYPCNSVLLQRAGDSDINTMINLSGSGPTNVPINTPIVVTWYYGNDGLFVLINGSHVWSSPKAHSNTYTNEVGTEGRLMADGTSGKLYDLRIFSSKHDDIEINNTIQSMSTELNIDLSTQFAFAS
jgi:hypothetical protein